MGFTPRFDLGTPFLLYNTPPGLYVASALVTALTGASALNALKAVVVAAFLCVPLLGASLAGTLEDRPRDLPKFVGLALSLFTSELYGLEFSFKNGMLNPAFALPFALATLVCFRRAQRDGSSRSLRWIALASVAFAATTFVHLLTTYMLVATLGCFVFAAGLRSAGRSVVHAVAVVAIGCGLAAFWLIPSLPFASRGDAAYTWMRRPQDTLSAVVDGSLFSSYPVAFYPRFVARSAAGVVASACAAVGIVLAVVRRNAAVGSCALTALLALGVALGPSRSFGVSLLPLYDRLLWYRFVTLLTVMTLIVAGWGAWRLWELRGRARCVVVAALVGGAVWAAIVVVQRAARIETVQAYAPFVADVDAVSDWLREHGDRRGRVFSEFLGQNVPEAPGVNYPRHMIPVLSGFGEAAGWVYENSEWAQYLLRLGPFWFDPFPVIELADRFDVSYVVACSPNFVRALSLDPRWKVALATKHATLFEAVAREPSLASAPGWDATVEHEGHTGGGYGYTIRVAPRAGERHARELLVKTGWSTAWSARGDDGDLPVRRTDDALVAIDLPADASATTITLTWDIGGLRRRGSRVSLIALFGVVALLGVARLDRGAPLLRRRFPVEPLGVGLGLAALAALFLRPRPVEDQPVGFGVRGGLATTFDTQRARVGAFDDAEANRLVRVLEGAWGQRALRGGSVARALVGADRAAAAIALAPIGPQRVTIRGTLDDAAAAPEGAGDGAPIGLVVRDPRNGEALCRAEARLGEEVVLPEGCARGGARGGPGLSRTLSFETRGTLVASAIEVNSGIVVVEGESMHNALDDGGYDALYTYGPPDEFPSNGVFFRARVAYGMPIALDRDVELPSPRYDVWVLGRVAPGDAARIRIEMEGRLVGDTDLSAGADPAASNDRSRWRWLPVGRAEGGGVRRLRATLHTSEPRSFGTADVDALAFVPGG